MFCLTATVSSSPIKRLIQTEYLRIQENEDNGLHDPTYVLVSAKVFFWSFSQQWFQCGSSKKESFLPELILFSP